ncbi:MAG: hypothetical protein CL512_03525 [Actinobacteria bacterium]|nr:hypothetical protein [Actinomycetota bacterium]|tara:strand:- start:4893 stop:5477 length:585 start_codon:yes stop_codon:yes gene_type:complete
MDSIDRQILLALIRDGRASVTELSEIVGKSHSATRERLQKLIIDGTIEKFTIDVNQEVLGPVVDAFVETKSKNDWSTEKFDSALLERSEIVDAVYLSGDFNYQIRVQCESINKLNDFLDFLRNQLNVEELRVKIALGTVSGYPRQLGLETEQQEKIVEEEAADAEVFDDEVFEEKEITSPVRVERRFDIRRAEY